MTEAFEKWVEKTSPPSMIPKNVRIHFWLRAFVREVERRAKPDPVYTNVKKAFRELVRDFGLEEER